MSDVGGIPADPFPLPLLTEDASLGEALNRLALLGEHTVPPCAAASITLIERGRPATMGLSNSIAMDLDTVQYESGGGPCLTAAEERRIVRIDDANTDPRWPPFSQVAARVGIRSSVSLPLTLDQEQLQGGVNLYGETPSAFGPHDIRLCTAFASQATAIVLNAHAYWAAVGLSRNLAAALETRASIEQAKGVLMATLQLTADEAFDELRRRSQRENRKLNQLALEIINDTIREQQ